jgi:serine/threonine protein kinase
LGSNDGRFDLEMASRPHRTPSRGRFAVSRNEIDGLIGAGGMGEVYRARDSRLARHVAIKTLSGAGAADPERVQRFETEARG